ncbi:filamentous hemagglutinin N-terminal domain-containing protein [Sodalinema gerasimenkoae]|uniref:two-partner secretion domain-containing protein n=1 Tax=Sodalinema gerasimenkoae TaxID=2862348 RepID=UPI001356EB51|nr:filamentous hemagglutinin N-terminal domain-containing protein [Sodalinema gerasimenkoae]
MTGVAIPLPALAQIVPDTTLPNNSTITPDQNRLIIDGGTQVETNLFHSFEEFSLPTGQEAFFDNPSTVDHIFTRVTGDSLSNIDGLIRANNANLFLLNPNGLIFGTNARLDIGGSFLGTTAERFEFADGTEFGRTPSPQMPLLTMTVPVGLQFGATPGNIEVFGLGHNLTPQPGTGAVMRSPAGGLQVESGQSLTLLSGDISLNGGNLTAEQGNIHLGTLGGNSQVSLDNLFQPNYSGVENSGSIDLRQRASIDVSGAGGGTIDLRSQRLGIQDGSTILSLTEGNEPGRSINIDISDAVEVIGVNREQFAPSSILTQTQGLGSSGNLTLNAGQLSIRDGGQVSSSSFSPGRSGDVTVNLSEKLELSGGITVPDGFISSSLATATLGFGPAGDLTINSDVAVIQENARINADTLIEEAPAGNITLNVRELSLLSGGQLSATTFGTGNAGNIFIQATDFVEVIGGRESNDSGIFSQVEWRPSDTEGEPILATGRGGNLDIITPQLSLLGGGQVSASTFGGGQGGSISINTSEILTISGGRFHEGNIIPSAITAVTVGESNAGELTVNSQQIRVQDGGQITAGTRGPGDAGNLTITANDIDLSGTTPDGRPSRFTVRTEGPGESGNLRIEGNRLTVREGAEVNVDGILRDRDGTPLLNVPLGDAGDLTIQVRDLFLNNGRLTAETTSGESGNIIITANDFRLLNNSQVTTNAVGSATGGNIEIDTATLTALENSNINANAQEDFAGRVVLNTQGLFGTEFREESTPNSDITATSALGPDFSGIVEINTPEVDPVSALIELEDRPVNAAVDQNPCIQGSETEFVQTGSSGLPPGPNDPFTGTTGWEDLRLDPLDDPQVRDDSTEPLPSTPTQIRQAQTWHVNAEGELVLTAPGTGSNYRPPAAPDNCSPQSQAPQSEKSDRPGTSSPNQAFQVQGFQFQGNTVLSDAELAQSIDSFRNRDLQFPELQDLADRITAQYKDEGYITSGAYIPPQTTQNRVITVQILEGTLENIQVRTSGNLNPNYVVRRIQRFTEGPVKKEQLLQALQLLQLDPRIDRLSAELGAGVRAGTNLLNVQVQESNAVTASLSLDNDRSPTVGSFRQQADSGIANLFGIGDVTTLAYSNTEGTANWNLGYRLPINALDGTIGFLYSTGDSRIIEAPFDQVDIQADTRTYEVSYRQPLLRQVQPRSQENDRENHRENESSVPQDYVFREFAVGLSASRRDTQTSILDRNFPLSPGADDQGETNISVLRLFQDWTQRDSREVLALRSEFSLGVNWFEATVNESEPDSEFFAWRGQAQWVRRLSGMGTPGEAGTRLLVRGDAQLASTSLVPIEQFSLGGRRRMRGYRQDVLLADSGLFGSAEVQLPLFQFARRQGTVWLAPFVEVGTVWNLGDRANPDTSTLASAGLGLRLQLGDRLTAAVDWGIPLIELDTGNDTLQDNGLYFSIRFNPL